MKGLSLKNKIIIFAVAILTALLCVGATLNENVKKTAYAATPIFTAKLSEEVTKSFSAKFGGDVLFSAEKVLVNAYAANGQLKTEDENKITIYYNAKKYTYDSNRDVYTAEGEEDYFEKDGDVYAYYKKVDEQAISCVFDGSTLKFKLDGADKYAKIIQSKPSDYYTEVLEGGNVFYERTNDSAAIGESRYFYDYFYKDASKVDKKYVVGDNEFVMLENDFTNGQYVYEAGSDYTEVVLVSLGQYIYDGIENNFDQISQAGSGEGENNKMAGLTRLEVEATKNGESIQDLLHVRNVNANGNNFFDFMCIIPQDEGNEGFYQFTFKYSIGGESYESKFQFYIIFKTSYYGTVTYEGSSNEYQIQPTLGWEENGSSFAKHSSGEEEIRYYTGLSGVKTGEPAIVSYPSITYDYSKYSFSYTHTANGYITNYKFTYNAKTELGVEKGNLQYDVTSGNFTKTTTKTLKHVNNNRKIVTIILTDPGLYEFKFDYLYDGHNSANANINLDVLPLDNLYIHGADLVYSKYNYLSAEMRCLSVSTNEKDKVDLIMPSAFDLSGNDNKNIDDYKNTDIGFVYNTVNSDARVGNIVQNSSLDTLLNAELKNRDTITTDSGKGISENDYNYLTSNNGLLNDQFNSNKTVETYNNYFSSATNLNNVLNRIDYEKLKTNQGTLKFIANDIYVKAEYGETGSFYFYSEEKLTANNLFTPVKNSAGEIEGYNTTKYVINSETSFNKIGYYLVFLKIQPKGTEDGKPNPGDTYSYYQIFAFKYSTSTVNIEAKESTGLENYEDEKDVGTNTFTRNNVVVRWVEPGVFERKLQAKYYTTSVASDYTYSQIIARNNYAELLNGETVLGSGVAEGEYLKYLIEIKSEGDSATYHIFTIDRAPITNVASYVVAKKYAGTKYYYSYDLDNYGHEKRIDNGITDSFATISWQPKLSGAKVKVTYSWTEFVKDTSITPNLISPLGESWLTTNYKLADTIEGYTFTEVVSKSYLESSSVVKDQGIYIFTLTDEAGNSCKYVLVIDRTENFFIVDSTPYDGEANGVPIATGSTLTYGADVAYDIGESKALVLRTDAEKNKNLETFLTAINYADNSLLTEFGYYLGNFNNVTKLRDLFKNASSQNYLIVKNRSVDAYDDRDNKVPQISGTSGVIKYKESNSTSMISTLFVKGENHVKSSTYKEYDDTKSKITIEINTDNARGTVYYSSKVMTSPSSNRLYTGNNIDTHATNAEYVGFVWNIGVGEYEVSEVYYEFYEFSGNYVNSTTYYYTKVGGATTIYKDGEYNDLIGAKNLGDGRGFVLFSKNESATKEGLYTVTRKYASSLAEESNDKQVLTYYFIVDRNGIITDNGIGEDIKYMLLENETPFNNFSTIGTDTSFIFDENEGLNSGFNIYLSTTKLPATLQIPTGKYFNGSDAQSSANYKAGQLNFSLYFIDEYYQLGAVDKDGNPKKITEPLFKGRVENHSLGYFTIDLYNKCLASAEYKAKFGISETNNNWIYLPGIYAIVISDNVENVGSEHSNRIILGLEILPGTNPTVDIATGFDNNTLVSVKSSAADESKPYNYIVTTSEEFVAFTLPEYNEAETEKAQVDLNYLVVEQYINNQPQKAYINYPYAVQPGWQSLDGNDHIENVTVGGKVVSRTVYLDTMLRNGDNIDVENLDKELYYIVKIRYKLYSKDKVSDTEKYKNCYVYYVDGEGVSWYETKYKIVIDRKSPTNNINNLIYGNSSIANPIPQDNLVDDYNIQNGTETMFANGYHKLAGSSLYFTTQYDAYYTEKQANNIDRSLVYALKVTSNTFFDTTDVEKVLYRNLGSGAEDFVLSLPVVESNYPYKKTAEELAEVSTYEDILNEDSDALNNYYEIVELDAAGNATQYVVYYYNNQESLTLSFNMYLTSEKNISVKNIEFANETFSVLSIDGANTSDSYGKFFKIDLSNRGVKVGDTILTNFKTNLNSVADTLASRITESGAGTYEIIVTMPTAIATKSATISLYTERVPLNARNLISTNKINLNGANKVVNGVLYYAKKIEIISSEGTDTYTVKSISGDVVIYNEPTLSGGRTEKISLEWSSGVDRTYKIIITDVFNEVDSVNYNTVNGFDGFYSITFDAPGSYYYDSNKDIYYGFTNSTLTYNATIVNSYQIKVNNQLGSLDPTQYSNYGIVVEGNKIKFAAPYNVATTLGNVYTFKISFDEGGGLGESFTIVLDTNIPAVNLKDFTTYENKTMQVAMNIAEEELDEFKSDSIISGIMTLSWAIPENDYFTYIYTLRELDSNPEGEVLTGTYYTFMKGGTYQFVIKVYSINGEYLGNKVYAFNIAGDNELLYYVRDLDGKVIESNSKFKKDELNSEQIAKVQAKLSWYDIPSTNIPLYIVTQVDGDMPLSVVVNEDLVTYKQFVDLSQGEYIFYLYEVYAVTNVQYFGLLAVQPKNVLIANIRINEDEVNLQNSTFTYASDDANATYKISAQYSASNSDKIISKNSLILEMYYNGSEQPTLVKEFKGTENITTIVNYEILGNGYYVFMFKDLAGNVHTFGENSKLEITVLREVVVFVNNEVPIENAYYNEAVEMKIYASAQYNIGSISVTAKLNGKPYDAQTSQGYLFRDFGSYRIEVKAQYRDGTNLSKVICFTIINEKEVRPSIDLTCLSGYEISSVVNSRGKDVTEVFKQLLSTSTGANAMLVSYDKIYEQAEGLNLSTGKQTFALTYKVADKDYPTREQTFKFTLNNETPQVECSIAPGKTTTKGFDISFNPGVLYQQIGEAYILINDEIVATIDEYSTFNIMSISKTFENDGDGDYYIQLVGTSGNVWLSYKTTIKEPLNFWAIVIIIIVVAVVVGVVVTVIVLRNRMRIR